MLTDHEKELLRRSWRLVVPISDTAADLFYKRLFELRPEYASLFPSDMSGQKRKLMQMLAFVMHSLDWSDSAWREQVAVEDDLLLVVLALGRRHRDLYRIPDDSYQVVGEALLWTLDYGLGTAFTDEVRAVWLQVYRLLVSTMRMGSTLSERCATPPKEHALARGEALLHASATRSSAPVGGENTAYEPKTQPHSKERRANGSTSTS